MKDIIFPGGAPYIGPTEADILPTGVTPVTYDVRMHVGILLYAQGFLVFPYMVYDMNSWPLTCTRVYSIVPKRNGTVRSTLKKSSSTEGKVATSSNGYPMNWCRGMHATGIMQRAVTTTTRRSLITAALADTPPCFPESSEIIPRLYETRKQVEKMAAESKSFNCRHGAKNR